MDFIIGVNPTLIQLSTDTPAFKLGETAAVTDNVTGEERIYMFVKFNEQPTAVGYLEIVNPLTYIATMVTSTNALVGNGFPIGSAVSLPVAGGYGWIQIWGKSQVRSTAAIAVGAQTNTTATAGGISSTLTAATTAQISGVAVTTLTGAAGTTTAFLNFPMVLKAQQ